MVYQNQFVFKNIEQFQIMFENTSNIHYTYKFLGEEPCNKMELEINRLLLLSLLYWILRVTSFTIRQPSADQENKVGTNGYI